MKLEHISCPYKPLSRDHTLIVGAVDTCTVKWTTVHRLCPVKSAPSDDDDDVSCENTAGRSVVWSVWPSLTYWDGLYVLRQLSTQWWAL